MKQIILRTGRSSLFKKEVIKTRKWLDSVGIPPLNNEKRISLIEQSLKQITKDRPQNVCKICFSPLEFCIEKNPIKRNNLLELNTGNTNLSIGCLCGHIFHTECINSLTEIACPFCRTDTKFSRLFL